GLLPRLAAHQRRATRRRYEGRRGRRHHHLGEPGDRSMKTTAVTSTDLTRSVISVPPLARTADLELDDAANRRLLAHLRAGGVTTAMYGGNANLYNISYRQYEQLLGRLVEWAPADTWVIPSI